MIQTSNRRVNNGLGSPFLSNALPMKILYPFLILGILACVNSNSSESSSKEDGTAFTEHADQYVTIPKSIIDSYLDPTIYGDETGESKIVDLSVDDTSTGFSIIFNSFDGSFSNMYYGTYWLGIKEGKNPIKDGLVLIDMNEDGYDDLIYSFGGEGMGGGN